MSEQRLKVLIPLTTDEKLLAQLNRIEAAAQSLTPLLDLLIEPINTEETNLIFLLFQHLEAISKSQTALQLQVADLDQLVREVLGEAD